MSDHYLRNDKQLFEDFRDGDGNAFKAIYERYWQLLYVAAYKAVADEDEAKDIVQEVFISLHNKIDHLEIQTTLSAYLYTAVRYKSIDCLAKNKVRLSYLDSASHSAPIWDESTDQLVRERQIASEIEREVENLPEKMRQIFKMSRSLYMSHKEIADSLSISDTTVKKQINNALKILKPKFTHFLVWTLSLFLGHL